MVGCAYRAVCISLLSWGTDVGLKENERRRFFILVPNQTKTTLGGIHSSTCSWWTFPTHSLLLCWLITFTANVLAVKGEAKMFILEYQIFYIGFMYRAKDPRSSLFTYIMHKAELSRAPSCSGRARFICSPRFTSNCLNWSFVLTSGS